MMSLRRDRRAAAALQVAKLEEIQQEAEQEVAAILTAEREGQHAELSQWSLSDGLTVLQLQRRHQVSQRVGEILKQLCDLADDHGS